MSEKSELHLSIENQYGDNIVIDCEKHYLITDGNGHLMIHVGGSKYIDEELEEFKKRPSIDKNESLNFLIKGLTKDMIGRMIVTFTPSESSEIYQIAVIQFEKYSDEEIKQKMLDQYNLCNEGRDSIDKPNNIKIGDIV